jgi:hypothetical protein
MSLKDAEDYAQICKWTCISMIIFLTLLWLLFR